MPTHHPRAQLLTLLAIALLVAGCAPAASLTTTPPTPSSPAVPTPIPAADLELTRELVFAWEDSPGYISTQVIIEFKNQGAGWAQTFPDLNSDVFTFDTNGAQTGLGAGPLDYALPEFVAPGETGYLLAVNGGPTYGMVKVTDFATVEYALGPGSVPGVQMPGSKPCRCFRSVAPPGVTFEVGGINWLSDGSHLGLLASGSVTPSGGNAIPVARVAVLCIGADGSILGVTTALSLKNFLPDEPNAFETTVDTPPLKPSDCATSLGLFAQDHSGHSQD
jgi:hypothetical protein